MSLLDRLDTHARHRVARGASQRELDLYRDLHAGHRAQAAEIARLRALIEEREDEANNLGVGVPPSPPDLTPRQRAVWPHLLAGLTYKQIARAVDRSPNTVKEQACEVYAKCGVPNRTALQLKDGRTP